MSNTRTDRASAAASSLAIVGAFACLACTLILIAATIVLALIPVFVPSATSTSSDAATQSKQVQIVANVEGSAENRKRDLNSSYEGCSLDTNGTSVIRLFLLSRLSASSIIRGLTIDNITLINNPSTGGYAFNILMVILFKPTCLYACQLKNGGGLKSRLMNSTDSTGNLGKLQLRKAGAAFLLWKLTRISIAYVSDIYPGTFGGSSFGHLSINGNTTTNGSNSTSG